jgi:2-aminobenzoate-CoA ligase
MRDSCVRDRLPPPEAQPEYVFELPELAYPERLTAAVALIEGHAPDGLALVNGSGQWTYGDMQRLSNRIARLLVEQESLIPGNRVLLRGSNGAMLFAAWLGVLKAGGVVVPTMPMLRAREIAVILDKADVSHAIVDDRTLDDFAAACELARSAPSVLTYHGDVGGGAMEARLAGLPDDFVAADTRCDDPALIAFTSGTTGEPKGCVQFHRDILAVADTFGRPLVKPQPGDRLACSAPIAFTFGLGALVIFPWRFGATSVTVETGTPLPGATTRPKFFIKPRIWLLSLVEISRSWLRAPTGVRVNMASNDLTRTAL